MLKTLILTMLIIIAILNIAKADEESQCSWKGTDLLTFYFWHLILV